jgi:predicted RNA-binding protein with RPS1 domain
MGLYLLPTGEGVVIKRTKYGFYVDMPYQKGIFIHYSETLNESVFDSIDDNQNKDADADNPA